MKIYFAGQGVHLEETNINNYSSELNILISYKDVKERKITAKRLLALKNRKGRFKRTRYEK